PAVLGPVRTMIEYGTDRAVARSFSAGFGDGVISFARIVEIRQEVFLVAHEIWDQPKTFTQFLRTSHFDSALKQPGGDIFLNVLRQQPRHNIALIRRRLGSQCRKKTVRNRSSRAPLFLRINPAWRLGGADI